MAFVVMNVFGILKTVAADGAEAVRIGLAWQLSESNYDRVIRSIKAAGAVPVVLDQMRPDGFDYEGDVIENKYLDDNGILLQSYADEIKKNTYKGTDIAQKMQDVDAVVFLGGGDVCPTLFANPEPWHGIEEERNYNATRDISEFITMAYCLDNDIPVLGLCRGMQLLGVVSGAPLIQDLGTYYATNGKKDHGLHRAISDVDGNRHYTPHTVTVVDTSSLLYSIVGSDVIYNVPSFHHQAVGSVKGTPLKVTAITSFDSIDVIEAIERTDKTFALGVQFHPEEAVRKELDNDADAYRFMSADEGLDYFRALIKQVLLLKQK